MMALIHKVMDSLRLSLSLGNKGQVCKMKNSSMQGDQVRGDKVVYNITNQQAEKNKDKDTDKDFILQTREAVIKLIQASLRSYMPALERPDFSEIDKYLEDHGHHMAQVPETKAMHVFIAAFKNKMYSAISNDQPRSQERMDKKCEDKLWIGRCLGIFSCIDVQSKEKLAQFDFMVESV